MSFRVTECALPVSWFLTNCCVIVEPPWTADLCSMSAQERAPHAADVDAAVLVEPPVLRRDDRLLDPRRDLVALHEHAALAAAKHGEDRVTVAGVDVPVDLLPRGLLERVEPGQLLADGQHETEREGRHRKDAQDTDEGE